MRDFGIDKGLVQEFQTSDRKTGIGKRFYGFRKMFWTYLNKLNVPFYDACCVEANGSSEDLSVFPLRYNATDDVIQRFDGTEWVTPSAGDITLDDVVANTVTTDSIDETTSGAGITLLANTVRNTSLAAHDVTGTATGAEIVGGTITSTSAAAVALQLPTVAAVVAAAPSATRGTVIDFFIDNGLGANTVTLTAGTGMTASSAITGGTTLTVASGVVGQFRLYIQSGTTAKLSRIA